MRGVEVGAIIGGLALLLVIVLASFRLSERAGYEKCELAVSVPEAVEKLKASLDDKDLELTRLKAAKAESDALAAIPARVIRTPIFLHDRPLCDAVINAGPAVQNTGADAGAGTAVTRFRDDSRPAIEAFKRRYETVIESARAALAECPTVQMVPLPNS